MAGLEMCSDSPVRTNALKTTCGIEKHRRRMFSARASSLPCPTTGHCGATTSEITYQVLSRISALTLLHSTSPPLPTGVVSPFNYVHPGNIALSDIIRDVLALLNIRKKRSNKACEELVASLQMGGGTGEDGIDNAEEETDYQDEIAAQQVPSSVRGYSKDDDEAPETKSCAPRNTVRFATNDQHSAHAGKPTTLVDALAARATKKAADADGSRAATRHPRSVGDRRTELV